MKFPRVSPGLSLIEALWDSLYMQDVIEEQYFNMVKTVAKTPPSLVLDSAFV